MKIKRVEHIAIAVNSLEQSIELLKNTFGLPLEYEEQIGETRLAMLPVGQSYIELLEGQSPESGVTKWISEKGAGLFHICFEVEDIDGALACFTRASERPGLVGELALMELARFDSQNRFWRACAILQFIIHAHRFRAM